MNSTHLAPALEYLTDAAHLLRSSAAETSAHLMKQRGDLLLQHNLLPSPVQQQHVCGVCGHIMIPGDAGTVLKLEPRKSPARKLKTKQQPEPVGPVKSTACGRCARITKTSLAPPEGPVRRRAVKRATYKQTEPPVAPKIATANASSKKRAKNRKAGLQALLSGQQQRSANPLSLGDFMKK